MKKIFKVLLGFFIGIVGIATPLLCNNLSFNKSMALETKTYYSTAEKDSTVNQALEAISITQDGYVFSAKDFEIRTVNNEKRYFLYVNTAITIRNIASNTLLTYQYGAFVNNLQSNEAFTIQMGALASSSFDVQLQTYYLLTQSYGPKLTFTLVQTPINFDTTTAFNWKDNNSDTVIAPSKVRPYSTQLTLSTIAGTQESPIFVDFYYNGEFYSLYNVEGKFYNTLTHNQIKQTQLAFNIPGQYEVHIYDKTCMAALKTVTLWPKDPQKEQSLLAFDKTRTGYSGYANARSFEFSVVNNSSADNIYVIAKSDSDKLIVSGQTVNSQVKIQFYNLLNANIGKIEVLKHHTGLRGDNIPETEILYSKDGTGKYLVLSSFFESDSQNTPISIPYKDDGSYVVNIYDKAGNKIWDKPFEFIILTDIHNSYDGLSSTERALVPEDNIAYPINQTKTYVTTYKGITELVPAGENQFTEVDLQSSTTSSYVVKLARANCSIEGINHGDKVQGEVSLTINGVGKINVTVYKDGLESEQKVITKTNGNPLVYSEVGKYKVIAVDEMGTVLTKSFTIRQTYGGATIALIVIGAVAAVLLVVMIIRTRTKIKVR